MRKCFSILVCFLITVSVFSQNDITIGLVMPDAELDGIRPDSYKILRSKLEKMLTSTGVSSFGGDFVMYPVVNIIDEELIEGGIKNFYKVDIELVLNVVNLTSKTLFSSETWPLSGSDEREKRGAVKNAMSQLKSNDPRFKDFIVRTKSKIADYYAENKQSILMQASTMAANGNHEAAIAFLSTYPAQVSGYDEAQSLMKTIYNQYIESNAASVLSEAHAAYSVKDYEKAVDLASRIVPESSRYKEAQALMDKVRSTIVSEEKEEYRRAQKALDRAADVEKTRINAAVSVAKAYYGRRVVNYNTIRVY